jgi:hypothetical protein
MKFIRTSDKRYINIDQMIEVIPKYADDGGLSHVMCWANDKVPCVISDPDDARALMLYVHDNELVATKANYGRNSSS